MEFKYTNKFMYDLNDRLKTLTIFNCSLAKQDNINDTNLDRLKKVEVPVKTAVGRINEDLYIIEIDYQSVASSKLLVDGLQFFRYNEFRLYYYDESDSTNKKYLAGIAKINKSMNSKLFDYTKNYMYIDLSPFTINCHLHLLKTVVDPLVGSETSPRESIGLTNDHKHCLDNNNTLMSSEKVFNSILGKE